MNLARRVLLTVLVASVPMAAWGQPPTANANADLRIAYFSAERAFAESADGKAAIARITALRDEKARAIEARNRELAGKEQALKMNAAFLTESARTQQSADVEKFRVDTQRFVEDAQAEVTGVQRDLESAFLAKLKPAVDKVITTRGVQLVLSIDTPLVVWFDPADDITADVVKQLAADATPKE